MEKAKSILYVVSREIQLMTVLNLCQKTNENKDLLVNVNIRMYNFDDVQCTVIPSVAYGFVTGMNLQLC